MAWRPYANFVEGELDNTKLGVVTGWMIFLGLPQVATLRLKGDFHRDIRGTIIQLHNPSPSKPVDGYMEGFAPDQRGDVGDITAGLPPHDYVNYPYIEWYSETNGRVVLELDHHQLKVIGPPIPWEDAEPISRQTQHDNLMQFLTSLTVPKRYFTKQ